MIIQVNYEIASPEVVSYREMGFGEKPFGIPLVGYRLEFPITEVLELLRPTYDAWIRDQKADDETTGDPYPTYFHDLAYPQLAEFAKHPVFLCDVVKRFFFSDLLASLFLPASGENVKWIINSVDSVVIADGHLVITGTTYTKVQSM